MSDKIKLQQPIINGSLRSTNFFNGRLVTGADMSREQTARREAVSPSVRRRAKASHTVWKSNTMFPPKANPLSMLTRVWRSTVAGRLCIC